MRKSNATGEAVAGETIEGEVTASEEPVDAPQEQVAGVPNVYRISAIAPGGFCRAGRRWFREGEEVNRQDFSDEQWAALTGEPMLTVVAL